MDPFHGKIFLLLQLQKQLPQLMLILQRLQPSIPLNLMFLLKKPNQSHTISAKFNFMRNSAKYIHILYNDKIVWSVHRHFQFVASTKMLHYSHIFHIQFLSLALYPFPHFHLIRESLIQFLLQIFDLVSQLLVLQCNHILDMIKQDYLKISLIVYHIMGRISFNLLT